MKRDKMIYAQRREQCMMKELRGLIVRAAIGAAILMVVFSLASFLG